ncbi:MAG: type II toxin-antitoxin system VapC family toxin [Gemmatimonadaceae bacterium]
MARKTFNVVDSSAWLAWFADEPGAVSFGPAIEDTELLIVPTICLTEVFKVVARQRGEGDALQAIAIMQQGQVVALDGELALAAAVVGATHKLPLANSIVFATARQFDALVWTQDEDFEGLPGARYFRKRRN